MIKVDNYEVKNTMEELTIGEFEKVSHILNDVGLSTIDKYVGILAELGVPEEVLDEMLIQDFKQVVKDFNDVEHKEFETIKEIELNGYIYKAFEDEFKLSVKDLKMIEKRLQEGKGDYMAYTLAVIFKRTDLTKAEHYAPAHIKQKEKLFKSLPAYYCVYYIGEVASKIKND